jgi:hypothetical protein
MPFFCSIIYGRIEDRISTITPDVIEKLMTSTRGKTNADIAIDNGIVAFPIKLTAVIIFGRSNSLLSVWK